MAASHEALPLVDDTTKIKYGKSFFDYDEIDYFHIDIGTPKFKGKHGFYDSILCRAILYCLILDSNRFMPLKDNDTIHEEQNFKYYSKIGFKKYSIKQEDFEQINHVFCAKSGGEIVSAACIPVYRDHLVFKRNNKIIGHTFVCLSCMQYVINGKIEHKGDLGYEIDNLRLRRVLSKYNKNAAKHY